MTAWDDRLETLAFPAMRAGISIYTGRGEIYPEVKIGIKQAPQKPAGMPIWQVYEQPTEHHPGRRSLRLTQRGVSLSIPLGQGIETPDSEVGLAKQMLGTVLFIPVWVLAVYGAANDTMPIHPIILEIYSESGELLWENTLFDRSIQGLLALHRGDATMHPSREDEEPPPPQIDDTPADFVLPDETSLDILVPGQESLTYQTQEPATIPEIPVMEVQIASQRATVTVDLVVEAEEEGAPRTTPAKEKRPQKKHPHKVPIEVRLAVIDLKQRSEHYQSEALRHLAKTGIAQPSKLRNLLGLPTGSTEAMKQVSDTFLRFVLVPLKDKGLIAPVGYGRGVSYSLKRT